MAIAEADVAAYRDLVARLAAADAAAGREPLVPLIVPLRRTAPESGRRLGRAGQRRLNEQRTREQQVTESTQREASERAERRGYEEKQRRVHGENREEERHAAAMRAPRRPAGPPSPVHRPNIASSNFFVSPARSGEVRLIDAGVTILVAAGSVVWTATRQTLASELGWAAFWTLLGAFMYVEGAAGSEIKAAGAGVSAANASYISLRLFVPNLANP